MTEVVTEAVPPRPLPAPASTSKAPSARRVPEPAHAPVAVLPGEVVSSGAMEPSAKRNWVRITFASGMLNAAA